MKNIFITLGVLLTAFFVSWGIKARMPVERPDNVMTNTDVPWYMSSYSSTVENEWMLDPTIPDNYIPVPGEDEVYMIVDTSGNITGYKHRYMQEDGTWVWEDANPDIPDNYELVEGSENLYKVTDAEGNVTYYLYVRNEDNTYAFVPCDEFGVPYYDGEDAEIIASNYVHEDGNITYNNGKYTITMSIGNVPNYRGLIYKDEDGNWHRITDAKLSADGKSITFTTTTLSVPFAIVVEKTGASPKTGDVSLYYIVFALVSSIALAGFSAYKIKALKA